MKKILLIGLVALGACFSERGDATAPQRSATTDKARVDIRVRVCQPIYHREGSSEKVDTLPCKR